MKDQIPQELFDLETDIGNPILEGFALPNGDAHSILGTNETLDDDMTPGYRLSSLTHRWIQPKLKDVWKPPKVTGKVMPFNDYPCVSMLPAFSKRACDVLRDFLEPNGELLPLDSKVGEYYFYNITTISDAFDFKNSKSDFHLNPLIKGSHVDYFAFHKAKLQGLSIFRIHEWPMCTIVTDQFAARVKEHGLNGFNFKKIWPHERGVNWQLEHKKKKQIENKDIIDKRDNTLIVALTLAGKKPNASEKRKIKVFETELESQLVVSSLEVPYFGKYEGYDIKKGQFKLVMSCPVAEDLRKKLEPWLNNIQWPAKVFVIKKYGGVFDLEVEEEIIEL